MAEPAPSFRRPTGLLNAFDLVPRVARARHLEETLGAILDGTIELAQAERAYLWTLEPDGVLRVSAARASGRVPLGPDELATSRSIARLVLEKRETLVFEHAGSDPRTRDARSVLGLRVTSVIAVPLLGPGEETLGVVVVEDRRRPFAFSEGHRRIVECVSALAALLLSNVRARARIESLNRELAASLERSEAERTRLGSQVDPTRPSKLRSRFEGLLKGESPAFDTLLRRIERCCATDLAVLVEGESGTGKELVAKAIHRKGKRAGKPFIALNVTEVPGTLFESTLFGYVKGSFTGALHDRPGLFREADGGTIFLDEIGELPLEHQVKLLRVLQEKTVRAVGGGTHEVDVRVIAATNRRLADRVRAGEFREDLYYRLKVMHLEVPSLRARREDIPLLARHFAEVAARGEGRRRPPFTREAIAALEGYSWPGNIRQLENVVRSAIGLGVDPIRVEDLDISSERIAATPLEEAERQTIARVLEETGGNRSLASRLLGMHRATLRRKMETYGLTIRRHAG